MFIFGYFTTLNRNFYLIIFYNHGGDKMDMKKIIFVLIISTLFMGCAFAANSINDLKVDEKYKHEAGNDCFPLNLNDNKDTGCVIFKMSMTMHTIKSVILMAISYKMTVGTI